MQSHDRSNVLSSVHVSSRQCWMWQWWAHAMHIAGRLHGPQRNKIRKLSELRLSYSGSAQQTFSAGLSTRTVNQDADTGAVMVRYTLSYRNSLRTSCCFRAATLNSFCVSAMSFAGEPDRNSPRSPQANVRPLPACALTKFASGSDACSS